MAEAFSADLKVRVTQGDETRSAKGLLAANPARGLRIEIHDPVGRTRLTVVLTDGRSALLLDGRYAEAAEGDVLARSLLDESIAIAELTDLVVDARAREGRISRARYEVERTSEGRSITLRFEGATIVLELSGIEPLDAPRAFDPPSHDGAQEMPAGTVPSLWDELSR